MNKEKDNIATNLKVLRKKYGLSQKDIGKIINTNYSEISRYENENRKPKFQDIKKLSAYFGITMEEFIYCDLSELVDVERTVDSKKKLESIVSEILMPLKTEVALQNEKFKEAFRLYETFFSIEGDIPVPKKKKCYKNFREAWKENNIPEALANILLLRLTEGIGEYEENPEMIEEVLYPQKDSQMYETVLLNYRDSIWEITMEKRKQYYRDNKGKIRRDLKKINAMPGWSDFVQYYIAMLYKFGIVDNDLSLEQNGMIGDHMLLSQLWMDNKYVVNYFKVLFPKTFSGE